MGGSGHSPGPWHVRADHDPEADHDHIDDANGEPVALVEYGEEETLGNGLLIAAAPTLYDLVKAVAIMQDGEGPLELNPEFIDRCAAIIARLDAPPSPDQGRPVDPRDPASRGGGGT